QVYCKNWFEVRIMLSQIKTYFKNGITINFGDTIFDVGANIGLFSLSIMHKCNMDLKIYAFEPVLDIYRILEENANYHNYKNFNIFQFGLSNHNHDCRFEFRHHATFLSTSTNDESDKEKIEFRDIMYNNLVKTHALLKYLPAIIAKKLLGTIFGFGYSQKHVTCKMITLSDFIKAHSIQVINLLKIDVEKDEFNVLKGISCEDWRRINQIVIEVHDIQDRLTQILKLLELHNFQKITIEQSPLFADTNLFQVYAVR
ncbi:MAG: FkbM family methyltransferase, partial [Candidatus Cloacimonetes bacterium]|nr:FkbM family methyltransferase [Candidatus Cloacimonadota bacterium]